MRILIVTDAWSPQVNGVVRTLATTKRELERMGHTVGVISPLEFRTIPCPTYPEIRLAINTRSKVAYRIEAFAPDAMHIATEGPIGLAARRHALRTGMAFTTSFHTKFAEYVQARCGLPARFTYKGLRWFHRPAHAVMAATPAVKRELEGFGFDRVKLWGRGVDLDVFRPSDRNFLRAARPIFMYVGRVAVEKNIEAFLDLDLPGSKWVVGDGPQRAELQRRYTNVHFAGFQQGEALARHYAAADVCVFPSRTDTFGLVMLEAMACGTPVAAYPVPGPIDVIGTSDAGVLDDDLQRACLGALGIDRSRALARAQAFSWAGAAAQFLGNLTPSRATARFALAPVGLAVPPQ